MTSLQEERERTRGAYEKRIEEITSEMETCKKNTTGLNELYIEQQKRAQKLMDDLSDKNEEVKRTRQAQHIAEEKLGIFEVKLNREMDEMRKKQQKEADDWRLKNEQLMARNTELSRANNELRLRLQSIEADYKGLADKVSKNYFFC